MATIHQRVLSQEPGVRVELYEVDLTPKGGTVLRFHNHTTANGATISRTSTEVYTAYPIRVEGFEYKAGGILPRPHLFVSNIGSVISSLLRQYDDCIDCILTRHVTFEEFLYRIGGGAVQGTYDANAQYPPDVFVIDRRVMETSTEVEFELVAASDMEGVMLPRRQYLANACPWTFRGPECGYAGVPKQYVNDSNQVALFEATTVPTEPFDVWTEGHAYAQWERAYILVNGIRSYYVSRINGNLSPLTTLAHWLHDICPKRIADCKVHFGANAVLPAGSFPGCSRLPRS